MSLTDQLKKASLRTAFSYLEKNPEKLRRMVEQTGAHSTELQSPETAAHRRPPVAMHLREEIKNASFTSPERGGQRNSAGGVSGGTQNTI